MMGESKASNGWSEHAPCGRNRWVKNEVTRDFDIHIRVSMYWILCFFCSPDPETKNEEMQNSPSNAAIS